MLQELYLEKTHIRRHCLEVKSYFWDYLEQKMEEAIGRLLEEGLKIEAEWQIGCGRYQRGKSRRDGLAIPIVIVQSIVLMWSI